VSQRAEKQLALLGDSSQDAQLGGLLYRSAIQAEKTRHDTFRNQDFPKQPAKPSGPGLLNASEFGTLSDVDEVLGARLEVFVAGSYVWVPFEHIELIEIAAPRRLRDTLWLPATVITGAAFNGSDLGDVLLPAVYPFSWKSDDEAVWLGRRTEWVQDDEGNAFPVGQKMLRADDREIALLEVRQITFSAGAQSFHVAT